MSVVVHYLHITHLPFPEPKPYKQTSSKVQVRAGILCIKNVENFIFNFLRWVAIGEILVANGLRDLLEKANAKINSSHPHEVQWSSKGEFCTDYCFYCLTFGYLDIIHQFLTSERRGEVEEEVKENSRVEKNERNQARNKAGTLGGTWASKWISGHVRKQAGSGEEENRGDDEKDDEEHKDQEDEDWEEHMSRKRLYKSASLWIRKCVYMWREIFSQSFKALQVHF